ncbi:SDR family NAD(P)-dependent oxidoreductase [Candidatus Nanohalococcus occultus]|uniref:Short-chain alcohol dehydrogenase n=1 Tax=Candidatus Nanohalococcus occultus TaxID=2978047 RepID=A0ABY8CFT8_9ARCH|nr:Short-chain alcohol dehydrogenase [Candidatus Nanohaloarchaeota archaeon SVXNc]
MKVLITGAANGIGEATTEKLLEKEIEVIAVDNDKDALKELSEAVKTYECDVRNENEVQDLVGGLEFDVLVNCAGFYELGAVADVSSDTAEKMIDTNFHGYLNLIRHSMETLRDSDGRVVNVSSIAGRVSTPYFGVYSASKHAVEAMSDALRMRKHRTTWM